MKLDRRNFFKGLLGGVAVQKVLDAHPIPAPLKPAPRAFEPSVLPNQTTEFVSGFTYPCSAIVAVSTCAVGSCLGYGPSVEIRAQIVEPKLIGPVQAPPPKASGGSGTIDFKELVERHDGPPSFDFDSLMKRYGKNE